MTRPSYPGRRRRKKPRILLCTPEVTELPEGVGNAANFVRAKGGGLADISAGLFAHLHESTEFDVHIAIPKYDRQFVGDTSHFRQLELDAPKWERQGIHLVADSAFTNLSQVYEQTGENSPVRRSLAFQRMVINRFLDTLTPDLVHCNDWMTGLIPAACRDRGIPCVFTIHNLFTYWSTPAHIDFHGIDVKRLHNGFWYQWFPDGSASDWQYNHIDFASSGVLSANVVNTVSPTFAKEVLSGWHDGWAPPSLMAAIKGHPRFVGILNAPNDTVRSDATGRGYAPFDADGVNAGKAANKQELQRATGLEVNPARPLFFWPHRLYAQKSPDLILHTFGSAIERFGAQLIVVANGDNNIESSFDSLARWRPGSVARTRFDQTLSDLARAGSDFMLMPSRYEPCGLPQLECPRFGTLPIVRRTGGLADTVTELSPGDGNGFVFDRIDAGELLSAMARAAAFHRSGSREATLQRVMRESTQRFSLGTTTDAYMRVYDDLLA
ncbi:MAG: glycogen/starch synthase [Myxococcota bacterium]